MPPAGVGEPVLHGFIAVTMKNESTNSSQPIKGLVLGCLALFLVQLFCFITILKQVGFYLDDWIMINTLSFGPDNFIELLKYYFQEDSRVVNRPIEALHFVCMFLMFGIKPLGYHIFNFVMEVMAACLLFVVLAKLSGRRSIAFLASALFLLFPTHNITHYWIVSSSVTLSLVLYLGSLLCDVIAVLKNKIYLHFISAFLFLLMLFNYEVFMSLAAVNVATVFFLKLKDNSFKNALKTAAIVGLNLAIPFVILFVYLKFIMPMIGPAWTHRVQFDPGLMVSTLVEGTQISLASFDYFFKQTAMKFSSGLNFQDTLLLILLPVSLIATFITLKKSDANESQLDWKQGEYVSALTLTILGLFCVVISYTVFGLNPEYKPTLITIVNRINAGAVIGVAFIFSGFCLFVSQYFQSIKKSATGTGLLASLSALLICLFTLTNWSLAHPFIISWQVQKQIMNSVKNNKDTFKEAQSVLLANCPRYVNEAPVFDGVWDFQCMLRLVLKNKKILGGTTCARLHLTKDDIKDRSPMGGFLCATHSYDKLFVIISPVCDIVRVKSPEELIDLVERRGMQFEEDKQLPQKWRMQLEKSNEK